MSFVYGQSYNEYKDENKKDKTAARQFDEKYGVRLNKLKQNEKRLKEMIKNGGGTILSWPKNDQQIQKLKNEYGSQASISDYETNLGFKENIINTQIKMCVKAGEEIDRFQNENTGIIEIYIDALSKSADVGTIDEMKGRAKDRAEKEIYKTQTYKWRLTEDGQYEKISVEPKYTIKAGTIPTDDEIKKEDDAKKEAQEKEKLIVNDTVKSIGVAYLKVCEQIDNAFKLSEKNAKSMLKLCKKAATNALKEKELDILQKAEGECQKISKKIANIPTETINKFKQIEQLLYKLSFGIEKFFKDDGTDDMQLLEKRIDVMLNSVQKLLDPVFDISSILGLPVPGIVAPIKDLITMLPNMGKPPPGLTQEQLDLIEKYKTLPHPPQIPQSWYKSLYDMTCSIGTTMALFPLCLINLIFSMLDAIVNMFMQIAGILGVPTIPYPLNLIHQCLSLMPKLIPLSYQLPSVLKNVVEKKMKDMAAQMMALGTATGSAIKGVFKPNPTCPEAVKQNLIEAKLEKQKQKALEKEIKKDEAKKKAEEELKNKAKAKNLNYEAWLKTPDGQQEYERQVLKAQKKEELKLANKCFGLYEDYENKKLIKELESMATEITPNNSDLCPPNNTVSKNEESNAFFNGELDNSNFES